VTFRDPLSWKLSSQLAPPAKEHCRPVLQPSAAGRPFPFKVRSPRTLLPSVNIRDAAGRVCEESPAPFVDVERGWVPNAAIPLEALHIAAGSRL
jgi:hypothetical protein